MVKKKKVEMIDVVINDEHNCPHCEDRLKDNDDFFCKLWIKYRKNVDLKIKKK